MFRVSKTEERTRTLITVDGQLAGDGVEVVEVCCEQELSTGKPVDILLRDLTVIDQPGKALLCRLAAKGVRLRANGIYTAHVVRTIAQAKHGES